MSWLELAAALLDTARATTELAVNWLIQSTLLIGGGLLLGYLLRRRGSAVQSAVYRTTLVAALACPLATGGLSLLGISGWSLEMPAPYSLESQTISPDEPTNTAKATSASPINIDAYTAPSFDGLAFDAAESVEFPLPSTLPDTFNDGPDDINLIAPPASEAPAPVATVTNPTTRAMDVHRFGLFAVTGGALWVVGNVWLIGRLLRGWRQLRRLRRGARGAEPSTLETCRKVAALLRVTPPQVLHSPYLPSPCLAGVRRPAVLLPEAHTSLPLRDVLVHELAHLRRHDCFWNLLRRAATAVFFFQPLLWKLSRRLEATAEEVCDDYVMQLGGDRHEYAHRLVDIAELSVAPLAAAGVGIVSFRSMLTRRVERILDSSRSLSTRIGHALFVLVLIGGLAATTLVGLVGLGPQQGAAIADITQPEADDTAGTEPDSAPASAPQAPETTNAASQSSAPQNSVDPPNDDNNDGEVALDDSVQHIRGQVVGPDGEPVAGAKVFAAWVFVGGDWPRSRREPSQRSEHVVVAETTSNAAGEFSQTFSKESPHPRRLGHSWHIVAVADGFAPDWMTALQLHKDPNATLQLVRDGTIEGRIVDLEGNPIPGVRVRVHELGPSQSEEDVRDWLVAAKQQRPRAQLSDYFTASSMDASEKAARFPANRQNGHLHEGSPALPTATISDSDGRFQFANLGPNRLAIVEIDGPSIAKCCLQVVTRDMEPISARPLNFVGIHSDTYFGRKFQFVAAPTQPIEGTVNDAITGEPLAGILVRLGQFANNIYSQQDFLTTQTDEEGRYRLVGAPQGGGHRIDVLPAPDRPYFPTEKTLPSVSGDFAPIQCDFELRPGTWIVGTVTDSESGKPIVDATVEYRPLRTNENAKEYPNYRPEITGSVPSDRHRTDEDGRFRTLAIPGPGILAAIAQNDDRHVYPTLSVDDVPKHLIGDAPHVNTYHPWTIVGYHALREVELHDSTKEAEYHLELTRGRTRTLKISDTNDKPVTGVQVLGRVFPSSYLEEPLDEPEVAIIGLRPDDERIVALLHPEKRIGKLLTTAAGEPMTIELERCAMVRGRFVDEDGQPVSGVDVQVTIDNSYNWHQALISATTDADGRFEALLAPGMTCRVSHYGGRDSPRFSAQFEPTPGAVFDLGEVPDGTKLTLEETAKKLVTDETLNNLSTSAPAENRDTDPTSLESAIVIRGRVVDDQGNPISGADVRLPDHVSDDGQRTTSGADGRFEIVFDKTRFNKPQWHAEPWRNARLVATAEGFGPCWTGGGELAADPNLTLKLKRDSVPVRGQILSLEGQPVRRATLEVWDIYEPHTGNVDGLLEIVRDDPSMVQPYMNREMDYFSGRLLNLHMVRGELSRHKEKGNPVITTDDEGRFEFRGVGPERLVRMWLQGPNVVSTELRIITRTAIDPKWNRANVDRNARMMLDSGAALPELHQAEFQHFAGPSAPIPGIVRDKETGKPLQGIGVGGWLRNTDNHAHATTDANGRFELTGLAVEGTFQQLHAGPSEEDRERLPYLGAEKERLTYSATSPLSEADTTFELTRGILVRGRVIDAVTRKPVKARVEYLGYEDNPHVASLSDPLWPYAHAMSDDNGEFAIAVLPGPGALAVWTRLSSDVPDRYRPVDPKDFGVPVDDRGWIRTANVGFIHPWSYKAAKFIDFDPKDKPTQMDLTVTPLTDWARVRCIDQNGVIIDRVSVAGHLPWSGTFVAIAPRTDLDVGSGEGAYVKIAELGVASRKPVVFRDRDEKMAAILFPSQSAHRPRLDDLDSANDGVHLLTLKPAASITGKLVDADGSAVTSARVELHVLSDSNASDMYMEVEDTAVDKQGRFELRGLPAGRPYILAGGAASLGGGILRRDIELTPGQALDLGALDVTKAEKPERPE